jgi:hypothetical protein
MQNAGDTVLAAALAVGQKRYFTTTVAFDWARDGTFADPLSDLSAYLDDAVIDRQLAGVIPVEMQITEGYSGAKLTLTLSGTLPDGTPLWKVFSPYSGYGVYGTGGAVNTPMALDIKTLTPAGYTTTRQFTGWVDSAKPSRAAGTVTLICFDAIGQLENSITCYRWAVDGYRREVLYDLASPSGESYESGTGTACWLIDHVLRRAGFCHGPAFHPLVTLAWTLRGSTLPEIGTLMQERQTSYNNTWQFGIGAYNTPMHSPAMLTPTDVWSTAQGKYGPAFKNNASLGLFNGATRYLKNLEGSAQAATKYDPTLFGPLNSTILGFAAWVYIDRAAAGSPASYSQFFLSDLQKNFSGTNQYPANAFAYVSHATGAVSMTVTGEGSTAPQWTWSTGSLATGWHYVSWVVRFTPSQVRGSCWVDGVNVINDTTGGTTGGLGTLTYVWMQATTNAGTIHTEYPCQYAQWIIAPNYPLAAYPQPASTPPADPRYQASVDLAGQRLHWIPDVEQTPARDVIQNLVGADLGAFYATEAGVATFDSRATIKARQTAGAAVFDLTLDQVTELAPETTYASIANVVGFTASLKVARPYQNVYTESKADDFLVQPGAYQLWPVTLSEVQSVRVGAVTYRSFAQGYDPALSPTYLYWQNYMQYYGPNYWQDGFTGYQPYTRVANPPSAPPAGPNMSVAVAPGWVDTDQNPRHMRIVTNNGSSVAQEYAVDDSTPFLNIAGTVIQDRPVVVDSVRDTTSIARYKERIFNLPADDWHQDILWLRSVGASLLADTKNPTTAFDQVTVVGDPRRQLQDVCRIVDPDLPGAPGMTGATVAYGSVVGITRSISRSGSGAALVDQLTIRTFAP